MKFGHLHTHNEFSYLDGFGNAESWVAKAKELGIPYLALTNHGNIDGLIKFQKACDSAGIEAILGCEAYIVPDMSVKEREKRGHITLLVKNEQGWQNICKLLSIANIDGFYTKPRIDYSSLLKHLDGLIVLTGCTASFLTLEGGVDLLDDICNLIPKDVYIEAMPHLMQEQIDLNKWLIGISQSRNLPILATNDCHYIESSDKLTHEVLLAIQTKAKWNDRDRFRFSIDGLHLRSAEEMAKAFKRQGVFTEEEIDCIMEWPEDIYEKCQFRIPKKDISLPIVPGYENIDLGKFIWELAEKKLITLSQYWGTDRTNLYLERLREEWRLINNKGFSPYFMIVWELVNWCKKNDIMVGPGRGSVGGSLLAYLIGITCVDPIEYKLLFSRFISPDRIDYPDIDLDFEDIKRSLVKEHLAELYGKNHVAALSTFMTMKARGAVRDVARVFEINTKEVDEFAKSITEVAETDEKSIPEALQSDIGRAFSSKYTGIIKHMISLEGQVRGVGQHAAATIVSSEDLREGTRGNLAIRAGEKVCNWDMSDSEYVGLMKLDILGLNTLSVLHETQRLISQNRSGRLFLYHPESECYFVGDSIDISTGCEPIEFDFGKIPLNDETVYKDIADGNTTGLFQLSAWATTKIAKEIRARNILELSDVIALVRPGPLDSGMTAEYIERKNNGKQWEKLHPLYEEITNDTYGIIVYQEQIMEVINKVAGLPYSDADKIRKVIAKKRETKEFKPYEEAFIGGCLQQKTLTRKQAAEFWKSLQSHARYSFNRSHSCEYAMLGYWTAWCKVYFPTEFMCASLTHGAESKKEELVKECYRLGLRVVTPRIGVSDAYKWIAKENSLYAPFIEIKGVGEKIAAKCAEMKPSNVVATKPPDKYRGYFKNPNPRVCAGVTPAKTKIESILLDIGAYGNNPKPNIAEYFSFNVEAGERTNLNLIAGDASALPGISTLSNIPSGSIKGLIKEGMPYIISRTFSRCSKCALRKECKKPVAPSPGAFNIAIIGEAPGVEEDEKESGFVGRSGKLIWDELIKHDLRRDDFHVTNVCKCFPKESKTPSSQQISTCFEEWLSQELKQIECRLALAFGNTCQQALTGRNGGITTVNGTTEWIEKHRLWVCWCIHPSAVLRSRDSNMDKFITGISNFVNAIEVIC